MKAKISVLSHTYKDYMDLNLGCFIPGKVIDEAFRVLRCLKAVKIIPYYNEILQEFLDISSMAIEHFREEITRDIEQCLHQADSFESLELSNDDSSSNSRIILSLPANFNPQQLNRTFKKINNRLRANQKNAILMKEQFSEVRWKMKRQSFKMKRQRLKMQEYVEKINNFDKNMQGYINNIQNQDLMLQEHAKKMKSQNLKLQRCAKRIQDQDVQIADITKHIDCLSQKLRNLSSLECRDTTEVPKLRDTQRLAC
ncbi:F-box only protein 28-like [Phymastichus coffea]|uniref:F-box only protein 28-like n=1 Tax=Phymastichus coffea TaxID=108790 RepID=UPI00273B3E24|nr:F-box only protein 28-like [Phymastichus coffea]